MRPLVELVALVASLSWLAFLFLWGLLNHWSQRLKERRA